jgi:hypothetical protein
VFEHLNEVMEEIQVIIFIQVADLLLFIILIVSIMGRVKMTENWKFLQGVLSPGVVYLIPHLMDWRMIIF